jgi:hypothetical protein
METIDEAELIDGAILANARESRVALPGRIESYDATKQRANIRLQLSYYKPTTDGQQIAVEHPIVQNVPICFPQGGGYFLSFPMQKGDPVMVVFCDVAIGAWLSKGEPCEPGIGKMHGLAGAVAFPDGPQPSKTPLQSAGGSNMRIGKDGTDSAQIEMTSTEIHLGVGASKGVARNGDHTDCGTLSGTVLVAGTPVDVKFTYVDPDGTTLPVSTTANLKGKINESSSKVKAED